MEDRIKFSKEYKNSKKLNIKKIYYILRSKLVENIRKIRYHILYKKKFKKLNDSTFPTNIQFEPSTVCNASCITCPHQSIIRKKILSLETIKKIIDECAEHEVKEIHPINYNEFFLYPHAIEVLRYIKKKLPKTKVILFTNASVLNEKTSDIIIEERLLHQLNFSMDAFKKETYERVRGLNYDRVMKNTLYFMCKNSKIDNPIITEVTFTITDENDNETKDFKRFWKQYTKNIYFSVDDGRKSNNPYIIRKTNLPCLALFNTPVILSNGDVVSCCMDPHGTLVYGNIYKNTIQEIWNSTKYKSVRNAHLCGKRYTIGICKNCPMV